MKDKEHPGNWFDKLTLAIEVNLHSSSMFGSWTTLYRSAIPRILLSRSQFLPLAMEGERLVTLLDIFQTVKL